MNVQTQYGSYTLGTPQYLARNYYVRNDIYHSTEPDLDGQVDRVVCVSAADQTPIYLGRYVATCGYCWLGHGHSTAVHQHTVTVSQRG